MGCYSRLMVRHPFVLILVDVVLAFILGPLTVWIFGIPDFSDPTLGFDARGTEGQIWMNAAYQLYKARRDDVLLPYPSELVHPLTAEDLDTTSIRKKRFVADSKEAIQGCAFQSLSTLDSYSGRMVVTSKSGAKDILTKAHVHSICRLQDRFSQYNWPGKWCYMTSIPLLITAMVQKTSCFDITDDDIRKVKDYLKECAVYYFNGMLQPYCEDPSPPYVHCPLVPEVCRQLNAVYMFLHILTDMGFMEDGQTNKTDVTFSLIVVSSKWATQEGVSFRKAFADFYMKTFEGEGEVSDGDIVVAGSNFRLEKEVFNAYIVKDIPYYVLAMVLVVVILLIYLRSFVLMIAVVTNVILTLFLALFFYHYVLGLVFFPFINIMAALLLIAIGADDVFIIYDLWRNELRHNPESSYEEIMSETLRKGGLSIFITSLTTATALMTNLISPITTVRCFGIFSAICMLVNFVLMITWIPALIILIEKTFNKCCSDNMTQGSNRCTQTLAKVHDSFWGVVMMRIITKASPLWIVLHLAVGCLGCIAIFVKPGLNLPESADPKIFSPDHPFEIYNSEYKYRIRFEHDQFRKTTVGMIMFWGALGIDNGDHYNPEKPGTLVYVPIDVYSSENREYLNNACHILKQHSYVKTDKPCILEFLENLMSGPCKTEERAIDITPCCNHTKPVNDSTFRKCAPHILHRIKKRKDTFGEMMFDSNGTLRIFLFDIPTGKSQYGSVAYTTEFINTFDSLANNVMKNATGNLKNGWYSSYYGREFQLYYLQKAIKRGTISGIGVSLVTGFAVMLLTSGNIVISLYAVVTITLTIASTIGSLALLGWDLNVTESLTMTLSLGLAVDFTIHYGVAYKLSHKETRVDRVKDTIESVSSAVSMAALTTFISGIAVFPGRILAYRQFGVFLVLVMVFSWSFSTLFFLSLCYGIGPVGNTGEIMAIFRCCRRKRQRDTLSPDRPGHRNHPSTEANSATGALPMTTSIANAGTAMFANQSDATRMTPHYAEGSMDIKHRTKLANLGSSKVKISNGLRAGGDKQASNRHKASVVKPPHRKGKLPEPLRGHHGSTDNTREAAYSDSEWENPSGSDGSSGVTSRRPSNKHVYNVHVYCVGDMQANVNIHNSSPQKGRTTSDKVKR